MSRDPHSDDDFSFLPTVDDTEVPDPWARAKASRTPPAPPPVDLEPEPYVEPAIVAEAPAAPPAKVPPRFRLKVKPQSKPAAPPETPMEPPVEEVAPQTPEPFPEPEALVTVEEAAPVVAEPKPQAAVEPEKPAVEAKIPPAEQGKTTKLEEDKSGSKPVEPEHHTVIRPPGVEEHPKEDEVPLTPKEKMRAYWIMIGGQSLAFSVIFHLVIIAAAAFIVFSNVVEQHVDFLPGGGTQQGDAAEKSLAETVRMRRTPWVRKNPMERVASKSSVSDIKLPEPDLNTIALPDMSRKMNMAGFGSAGAGGGFGSGIGVGGKSGVTFQPIMMFGKDLKSKRMAVILDVSSSMAEYLTDVVKEVDRVAKGSPVICYFGCGLMPPPGKGPHIDDKVDLCKTPAFERFWRLWYGPAPFNATPEDLKKIKFDPKDRIPFEEVYRVLARRPGTYFVDYNGIVYAWTALVNDLVRNADALYWFSDFMDDVDEKEIKVVLENLKRRKQRLFIQPSIHGASFEQVRKGLVIPTGGDVVEPPSTK